MAHVGGTNGSRECNHRAWFFLVFCLLFVVSQLFFVGDNGRIVDGCRFFKSSLLLLLHPKISCSNFPPLHCFLTWCMMYKGAFMRGEENSFDFLCSSYISRNNGKTKWSVFVSNKEDFEFLCKGITASYVKASLQLLYTVENRDLVSTESSHCKTHRKKIEMHQD